MNQKLEEGLKEEMGYHIPTRNRCRDCRFLKLKDGFSDREWTAHCTFYSTMGRSLGEIDIEETGLCNKFEPKTK